MSCASLACCPLTLLSLTLILPLQPSSSFRGLLDHRATGYDDGKGRDPNQEEEKDAQSVDPTVLYTKICAKFTNGARAGWGFVLERTCTDGDCNSCEGPNLQRQCRKFDFSPHWDVVLRTPESFKEQHVDPKACLSSLLDTLRCRKKVADFFAILLYRTSTRTTASAPTTSTFRCPSTPRSTESVLESMAPLLATTPSISLRRGLRTSLPGGGASSFIPALHTRRFGLTRASVSQTIWRQHGFTNSTGAAVPQLPTTVQEVWQEFSYDQGASRLLQA